MEELAIAVTHGIGLALSLLGAVLLILAAAWSRNTWVVVSCCVYAATLVSLYAASTTLHSVRSPRWVRTLETIDHCCIYLLIAGTYTPVTLVSLRGEWGWALFGLVWGLCFLGVLMKVLWFDHVRKISTPLYIAMGLLVVIAFKPLLSAVQVPGVLWLVSCLHRRSWILRVAAATLWSRDLARLRPCGKCVPLPCDLLLRVPRPA